MFTRFNDWGYDAWDSDEAELDDEARREWRFIKYFEPFERKAKGVKMGVFPRKDFKVNEREYFYGYECPRFTDYTIWERIPWTEERQAYLDKWLKDYDSLIAQLKEKGLYKAIPCLVARKGFGHRKDKCPWYHSEEEKDHQAAKLVDEAIVARTKKIQEENAAYEAQIDKIAEEKKAEEAVKQAKLDEERRVREEAARKHMERWEHAAKQQEQLDAAVKQGSRRGRRNR